MPNKQGPLALSRERSWALLLDGADQQTIRIADVSADGTRAHSEIALLITDLPWVARWLRGSYTADEWPPETRLPSGASLSMEPVPKPELWIEQWALPSDHPQPAARKQIRRLMLFEEDLRPVVEWLLQYCNTHGLDLGSARPRAARADATEEMSASGTSGSSLIDPVTADAGASTPPAAATPRDQPSPPLTTARQPRTTGYPVEHLLYAPWKTPPAYLHAIRYALTGDRITAKELESVLADVRTNRSRAKPTADLLRGRARAQRRKSRIGDISAVLLFLATFWTVARGFPVFDRTVSPIAAVFFAGVVSAFAAFGFARFWAARPDWTDYGVDPNISIAEQRSVLAWDKVFAETEELLRSEIQLRRSWEAERPPTGYGSPPESDRP